MAEGARQCSRFCVSVRQRFYREIATNVLVFAIVSVLLRCELLRADKSRIFGRFDVDRTMVSCGAHKKNN